MQNIEGLGSFYLGKKFDADANSVADELLLYDAKDLTTHAVCVGMTGSGKTGLCLSLLEEAALDGVPAIAIDPKGDLGNLLLTFPRLAAEDFRPWVDPAEAARKGMTVDDYAARTAQQWTEGLAEWHEDGARIQRFRDAVDVAIYTPGSNAGMPLTVLRSFQAPSAEVLADVDALRDRISSAASGLLSLLGIDADPIRSREHILVSNLFDHAWKAGRHMDIAALIREIQQPPFEKVGFLDIESFYPSRERAELALRINNLLALLSFAGWLEGEPLDIQRLLYTPEGKPRLSIISIAHLSESERMFLVTILLNEVLTWVRAQPGTSSLRALLYMDEVFGYFPPSANPPSKKPMLTLLKQARAYGLGIVLATQNPVDLDYKGLSNTGTWFLGRLQTERDKLRVLDGLEGASADAGQHFDRQRTEAILSGLGQRVFLLNNVHDDEPVLFQTRWALSYLRGPLTRSQIQTLMAPRKEAAAGEAAPAATPAAPSPLAAAPPAPVREAATSTAE
ncbi:MAG: ATP-binding protein, partial [Planctomycetales bacterium]|nr:ATP-binding protein [Planctomycetales bacterium]